MLNPTIRLTLAALLAGTSSAALAEGAWRATETGVEVTPEQGPERAVRLHGGSVKAANTPDGGLAVELKLRMRDGIELNGHTTETGRRGDAATR